jgi:hypothetical protein
MLQGEAESLTRPQAGGETRRKTSGTPALGIYKKMNSVGVTEKKDRPYFTSVFSLLRL